MHGPRTLESLSFGRASEPMEYAHLAHLKLYKLGSWMAIKRQMMVLLFWPLPRGPGSAKALILEVMVYLTAERV